MRQNISLILFMLIIAMIVTVCDKTPTAPDRSNPLDPKHGPPKILSIAPDSAARDLRADTAIVVRFDDVMDIRTFSETTFKVQHTLDNQTVGLKGNFSFGQTAAQNIASVARFAPERFYLYNNTILVSLAGIKDVEGNNLAAAKSNWFFTTYPLAEISQLKLFVNGKSYSNGATIIFSANSTANLGLFGYKSLTDSLNVTTTVTWKPAPNLSVPPSGAARLIVGSKNELSALTACVYNKNASDKLDSVSLTVQIDTRGPDAPALRAPDDGKFLNKRPKFEWNSVLGAVRYVIVVDDEISFSLPNVIPEKEVAILSDSAAIDLADKLYYWRVLAINNLGNRGAWSSPIRKFTIDTIRPDKVRLRSPSEAQHTKDTLPIFMWFAVSDAAAYEFEVDNNADFSSPVERVELNALMYKVTIALSPDGFYLWHVRAKDAAGNLGDWSDSRQVIVDTTPPAPPILRKPDDNSEINDSTPEFDWGDVVVDAKFYEIQVDDNIDFSRPEAADTTLETSVYVVPNDKALKDSTYNWRVRSRDAAGNKSAWAGPRKVTIRTTTPGAPQPITPESGKAINDNTPSFTWTTVAGSGVKYELQVDNNADFFSAEINRPNISNPRFDTTRALSEGPQYWRVRARNAAGTPGAWSPASAFIIDTIISATAPQPLSPVNTEVNVSRPPFSWTPVTDATTTITYDLQAIKALTASNAPDSTRPQINQTGLSALTFTPQNPLPDSIYYWRVRARDAANNIGPWASFRSFRLYEPPPDKPTLVFPPNGQIIANNRPTLDWNDVFGVILSYDIQVTPNFGPNNGAIFSDLDINQTLNPPSELPVTLLNGIYAWRVRGRDILGNVLDWSLPGVIDVWRFTIDAPFPANPYLIAPNNNQTSVSTTPNFDWSNVTGANTYDLQVTDILNDFSTLKIDKSDLPVSEYQVAMTEALTSGTIYYWRARAKQNNNPTPGAWSRVRNFTVQ